MTPWALSVALFAIVFVLAGATFAGPVDDAQQSLGRGDFATALGILRPLAERGWSALSKVVQVES